MVQWLNENPGLALALIVAALNVIAEVVRAFSPRAADVIGSLIPHVRSLLEAVKPGAGKDLPPPGGAGLLLLVLAAGGAAGLTGCGSPMLVAVKAADGAWLVGDQARPVLEQTCIDPIPRATMAELAELRRVCEPAMLGYDTLRVAHVALRSAILAADAGTLDPLRLAPLVLQVGKAALALSESIRLVAGGR